MLKLASILTVAALAVSACSSQRDPAATISIASPASPSSTVAPATRKAIAEVVQQMMPGARIQSLQPSPVAGLYQVVARGRVMLLSGDGRYLIQGKAFDTSTGLPLSAATMRSLRREAIAQLDPARMIRFAPTDAKYTVTVFTDIDCPYCRALHANIDKINRLGIAVDYLFWPRTGLDTPSARKAIDVWCATDRKTALTRAFAGRTPPRARCTSPVARDFNLGISLGVHGTPTIMAANGQVLGGYVSPLELLDRLQQSAVR